jgi:hypothetical protein
MMKKLMFSLLIAVTLVSCNSASNSPTQFYTRITEAKLKAGAAIPQPSDKVILKVTGKIGADNGAGAISMDLATIESVGVVEFKVSDPFKKKSITYRGVFISDLLDLWQVKPEATKLHLVALNDYAVDVPIADLRKYQVLFALQADGQYMPVEDRGPAMLVFPYDNFTLDHLVYDSYWIWQIASIDVQ